MRSAALCVLLLLLACRNDTEPAEQAEPSAAAAPPARLLHDHGVDERSLATSELATATAALLRAHLGVPEDRRIAELLEQTWSTVCARLGIEHDRKRIAGLPALFELAEIDLYFGPDFIVSARCDTLQTTNGWELTFTQGRWWPRVK